jgi:hypothetical protein
MAQGGTFSPETWGPKSAAIIDRIVSAVDTLQAAGPVMILVARVPFLGASTNPAAPATAQTNADLAAALATRGVPLIDTFAFVNNPSRLRDTPSGGVDLMVGDYAMPKVPRSFAKKSDLVAPDDPRAIGPCRIFGPEWSDGGTTSELKCGTLEYQLTLFLDDNIHPSTLAMGLVANEYIKAFNTTYGLKIKPLKADEILGAAGIVEPEAEDDDN